MEKTITIQIPKEYDDVVFDKETNKIKFIKDSKLVNKVIIDGVEGYVLEVDDAGEPTVLCSDILGDMSWDDAMKKANQGPWHLPTVDEWKKYYEVVKKLDGGEWNFYWTSTQLNPYYSLYVDTDNCYNSFYTNAGFNSVRAFTYVGSKKIKIGNKVNIDGVEGYVLEVDDAGKPTVLCSDILGKMSWCDAMKIANRGLWHLPTVEEFKKYYKLIKELDGDWYYYWTSTEFNSHYARGVGMINGYGSNVTKTGSNYVRAFVYVGSKKEIKPKSWKEYRQQVCNTPCFAINIIHSEGCAIERNREEIPQVNEVNTEEEAKAVVALCKLIQLRDAWWGKWRPDWNDVNVPKYGISNQQNYIIGTDKWYKYNRILVFPSKEMRDEFLNTFRDLIEEAKPLL